MHRSGLPIVIVWSMIMLPLLKKQVTQFPCSSNYTVWLCDFSLLNHHHQCNTIVGFLWKRTFEVVCLHHRPNVYFGFPIKALTFFKYNVSTFPRNISKYINNRLLTWWAVPCCMYILSYSYTVFYLWIYGGWYKCQGGPIITCTQCGI